MGFLLRVFHVSLRIQPASQFFDSVLALYDLIDVNIAPMEECDLFALLDRSRILLTSPHGRQLGKSANRTKEKYAKPLEIIRKHGDRARADDSNNSKTIGKQ